MTNILVNYIFRAFIRLFMNCFINIDNAIIKCTALHSDYLVPFIRLIKHNEKISYIKYLSLINVI